MWGKKILILCTCLCFFITPAQNNGGSKEKSLKSERKVRRELRAEAKEKRRKERAEKKAIKEYHKRLQTKKVRKRMKTSRKTAIRNHDNKREFFVKRWFKKRKKV
jgi:hypothetical protein